MFQTQPYFSIVVPTYNRPERLHECLSTLSALDYPHDRYEVIVVDDGGDRPLNSIVSNFEQNMQIQLLHQSNAGPGAARNTGAAEAKGEYLAFTDDDCRPDPAWLLGFAGAIERHPDVLLGGDTLNGLPGNLWSAGSQAVQTWLYDYFDRVNVDWQFFASSNICVPTERFLELGGFDTQTIQFASEDREFSERWRCHGGQLYHVAAARIRHFHDLSAYRFIRQHFAYGRGAYRLHMARRYKTMPLPSRDWHWIREYLFGYPSREPALSDKLRMTVTAWLSFAITTAGYYVEHFKCDRTAG